MIQITTPAGAEACLTVSGPGDPVGEQALLVEGGRRSASAIALEPVETLFLSKAAFESLRGDEPMLDRVMVSVLTARVLRLTDQLVEALFVPAPTRVLRRARGCSRSLRRWGNTANSTMASLAGCTRPTVNRALRAAEEAGVVDLARRRIRVLDVAGLRRLAG